MAVTASIHVDAVTVSFDGSPALASVDLDVSSGEVVAIIGPSGAGKSTLLRVIAGLERLDAGRVLLDDRDLAGVPPHRRRVGLMFQEHALFPHRDVAGNIAFGLRMQRLSPRHISARVDELLHLVDLEGFGSRQIQTLSGGEQQRVALARALAPQPDVLLLDEPLGALDRTLRDRLVVDLRRVVTRLGITVLAVTHDQQEAFALADRIVVMDGGSVLRVGYPAELWERPRTARVATLLGFTNVLEIGVVGGCASTPWGDVDVSMPDGRVAIHLRSAGVRLGAESSGVRGTVVACRFAGLQTSVQVAVDGAPVLEALVPSAGAPRPGDEVGVTIDPGAVVTLGD
ncbi:MAG: ABC transporter ATP-binding protein [Acidimicrobiales bacterium]